MTAFLAYVFYEITFGPCFGCIFCHQIMGKEMNKKFHGFFILLLQITCQKCKKQYVGKTVQTLKQRHYGHRREIDKQSSHLGEHFAGPCGYNNLRIQVCIAQCGNFRIFLSLRFYVKSILENLKVPKLPFLLILRLLILLNW